MWKVDSVSGSAPLSAAQAKTHLRVDHSDEDALITSFIDAAINMVELYTGRKLRRSTIIEHQECFKRSLDLRWPVVALTEVAYIPSGSESYSTTDIYTTRDTLENRYIFQKADTTYPTISSDVYPLRITYTTGYADGEVPDALIQALYLFIGRMYENRSDARELQQVSTTIPTTAEYFMNPYRLNRFA